MAKYDADLNQLFIALASPTRRAILGRLRRGQASVSELAAPHQMALPSLMGHLNKLEDAGLVVSIKSGRVRVFTLSPGGLEPAQHWLSEQQMIWESRLDQFDDYVSNLAKKKKR